MQDVEKDHNPNEQIYSDGNNMIPRECKRLAEVDFPIAEVSKHAVQEKNSRCGHIPKVHIWPAARPTASSRAVLLALLLPDPCDPHCPQAFKDMARRLLQPVANCVPGTTDEELRKALVRFIADFANWKLAVNSTYLGVSRALVKAAHGDEPPLVVDPFAGGGSIPLEALRLGCEAFASDLNPMAFLILKVILEDIPRHRPGLAEKLRKVGTKIKAKAEEELADLYPADPDGATPITYLWARTVQCEAPNCGAEIPLMRSFWLCKKPKRKWALRHRVERRDGVPPHVEFEIFDPNTGHEVRGGTVTRAKATCLCCGTVLPPNRVRAQLTAQNGGADVVFDNEGRRIGGARLIAVVTLKPGEKGRHYRLATAADYAAVRRSQEQLADIIYTWERGGKNGVCPVPNEPLPLMSGTFNAPLYGMNSWGDLFTARQKVALTVLLATIKEQAAGLSINGLATLSFGKVVDMNNSLSSWQPHAEIPAHMMTRYAVPMRWDFSEAVSISESSGTITSAFKRTCEPLPNVEVLSKSASVEQADATDHPLPNQSAGVWFTDPPYYFAVPYADLSDFFYVWLKRALPEHLLLYNSRFSEDSLAPKGPELCEMAHWDQDRYAYKDKQFFEEGMTEAFAEGRRVLNETGVGAVVFAHKTTEGWEALLSGMIRGGWTITGSWPIATEMASRLRARDSAALATSIHLICRPRPQDAPIADWADVLWELPIRVGDWIERLQGEGIRGADLVFACIGPALEIFSRYRAVETAEGHKVGLPVYLEKVWEVVGRAALEQVLGTSEAQARNGLAGALEEDARLTALFLWTLQSTEVAEENGKKNGKGDEEAVAKVSAKGFSLPFDVVRRFAQPMGIDLSVWTGRIIGQKKGIVRLLPVAERAKELFGKDGANSAADWIERNPGATVQMALFPEFETSPRSKTRRTGKRKLLDRDTDLQSLDATTLDRVHAAMLLQSSGHANALRTLVDAEQDRGPDFLRLANALSALYPQGCNEKRLLDAMLLAVPR